MISGYEGGGEGDIGALIMVSIGSPVFFDDTMCVLAHEKTRQKSMVH
jgi:hypothetical protein